MSDQYNEMFNKLQNLLAEMHQCGQFDLLEVDETNTAFHLRWLANGDCTKSIIISGQDAFAPEVKIETDFQAD